YEDVIRQASSYLTDAQVSVYGVDARGLVGSIGADASSQGTNDLGLLKSGGEYGADVVSGHANLENTQASMALVASETGGRLFANRNDIDHAVMQSVADGSTYYLIGYYPEDKGWDGKFHTIQVTVDKPGLTVRSRRGYYATDPSQWAKENRNRDADLSTSMALVNPISTMIIFDARVMPPAGAAGKVKVPVDFLVDSHSLSYEDDKGSRKYELDFHVAAYGTDGKLAGHTDIGTKAGVKAENVAALEQGGFPYHMEIELPPGQFILRLGVRDVRTGFVGTADLPVTIGK
ncbi:MAG: VWA domain-containing protein, partial [Candidatus Acidiferrales bacterium]